MKGDTLKCEGCDEIIESQDPTYCATCCTMAGALEPTPAREGLSERELHETLLHSRMVLCRFREHVRRV